MKIEQMIGVLSSRFLGLIFLVLLALFIVFIMYYDAIEMPNSIGYVTLVIALVVSLIYYFFSKPSSNYIIGFAFAVWFVLGICAHTMNFLIAFDYQGRYVIESKRPLASYREEWTLRLDNNRIITLKVSDIASGDGANLDLQEGLFGVYFGNWRQ